MRHQVAKLVPALLVGGCSLIYNPSNIEKPAGDARMIDMGEVAVDVEIRADANPIDMTLTEAFPATLDEGVGTGGSRAGVVVLRGQQFVKDATSNLTVVLEPAVAGAAVLDSSEVSGNGDYIALSVSVPVTSCDDTGTIAVKATVSQNDGAGGRVSKSLDPAFTITCLDQLTVAPTTTVGLKALYSIINITGPLTIAPGVGSALVLRSASSIAVGNINVNATAREPGPGGGRGALNDVSTPEPATGPAPGGFPAALSSKGGGGAGYLMAGTVNNGGGAAGGMVGDIWISNYTTNRSSGGGGGAYQALNLGTPGAGGGGGGTVELTAAGTLTVGTVTADGGTGGTGTGTAGTAGDGAGGAGGTVLLRSGAMFAGGAVSVAKGAPGGGTTSAGTSSDGRVRADLASGTFPTNAQKGPMFVAMPTRVTVQTPAITFTGSTSDSSATLRVFDKADNVVANMTYSPVFGGGSPASAQVMPVLKAGYNRVCVWVAGGADTVPASVNCQTIAYLPP